MATNSFPVPLDPVIKTLAFEFATLVISSSIDFIPGLWPIISDLDFSKLYDVDDILINKKAFFFYDKALEGDTFKTVFHGINTQFFLEKFKYYTPDDYMDFVTKKNISNGLEQFYYNKLILFLYEIIEMEVY